jgi:hypothetical protein
MFADDLVLVSKSASGLQTALNNLSNYCNKWGLTVNLKKTKVIIFNKGGRLQHVLNLYNGLDFEWVKSYCYLCIVFSASGSFGQACGRLIEQAYKALFKMRSIDVRGNILSALKNNTLHFMK